MSRNASLALMVAGSIALLASCQDSTAPPAETPPQFVSMKRAWLPGERDATIAAIIANRSWAGTLFVGDISDLAPMVYADTDSVVVVVPNPLLAAQRAPGLQLVPQFSSGWDISGLDVRIIDTTQVPADTNDWVGVFWSNPAEQTQKGIVLAYRCTGLSGAALATCKSSRTATTPGGGNVAVNTATFDASGAKSGAGGGERRFTTGEYWEANSGNVRVLAAAYGGATTVTSGPFTGGTTANGSMQGRMQTISAPRLLPSAGPAITIDFCFNIPGVCSGNPSIGALRLTCLFRLPCTGQAGAALADRRRALALPAESPARH